MKSQRLVRFTFIFLLLAYLLWELYWYNQVGLSFIKWHTCVMIPIYIFVIIFMTQKLINKTIGSQIDKLYRSIFQSVFLSYFLWELFWYNQVGLSFIKWHTHLFFPLLLFTFIHKILSLLKANTKIKEIAIQIFIGLFFVELLLLITGFTKTKHEKYFGHYNNYNSGKMNTEENYYWIYKPSSVEHQISEEFHFTRHTNSLGYPDNDWRILKDSNELRVLCLGDSFTEGDGAHEDSSYVSFLRRKLANETNHPITVMNAGKRGSDPYFNYVNYKDRLQVFSPDIIVQTLSVNDLIDDIYVRGGMERFGKKYHLNFKKTSSFLETLFAISYTSRIFLRLFGYNELMINPSKYKYNYKQEQKAILNLFKAYSELAERNSAKLMVVLLPNYGNIETNYPFYFKELKDSLTKRNILTFDLREQYKEFENKSQTNLQKYYWQKDGHHNAKGYELMGNVIYQYIHQLKSIKY